MKKNKIYLFTICGIILLLAFINTSDVIISDKPLDKLNVEVKEITEREAKLTSTILTTQTEYIKLKGITVTIDKKLNKYQIINFLNKQDLTYVKRIEFWNKWNYYKGRYFTSGLIVMNKMQSQQGEYGSYNDWRYWFCHELGHSILWNKYKSGSEQFLVDINMDETCYLSYDVNTILKDKRLVWQK